MDAEIRDFGKHVAHCQVESASFLKRKPAQVSQKIIFKSDAILISLFKKLFAAEAQRVTRFPDNVLEKLQEPGAVFLFFFETDMAINFNKATQLFRVHFVVTLLHRMIGTLYAVKSHAAGPQHALNFGEDGIFLLRLNVAQHVETDYVIEAGIGERQAGEVAAEGC